MTMKRGLPPPGEETIKRIYHENNPENCLSTFA
ncbi:hypothetical protein J2129_000796 [Methanofollis sp. W23]|nr:hypothetical protein [Methanofollis sp. W23]